MHKNEMKRKVTAVLLYITSAFSIVWGLTYLFHGDIMSYHRCFLNLDNQHDYDLLNAFNNRVIPLFNGLMQILGGCMMALGIAVFYITRYSFLKGDKWSFGALLIVITFTFLPIMYVTHFVAVRIDKTECSSRPPWILFYCIFFVVILALINSMIPSKIYERFKRVS